MAVPSPSLKAALLVSLVAHVVLLAWGRWSLVPTQSAAGGGMRVDWRAGPAVPGSDGGLRPAARPPDPVAANPPPQLSRKPTPVLAARGPAQVPAAAPGLPVEVAEAASERRGEMAGRSGAGPAEAAERSAPAPVREGSSGDALRQYRLALALEARRFKRYPRLARERGWEGTVEVT
ncbi:MAG TPA: hypothetical protein VFK74_11010, partial [Azospira sp.]|nr:hypothetical protein [Azospira sp.]